MINKNVTTSKLTNVFTVSGLRNLNIGPVTVDVRHGSGSVCFRGPDVAIAVGVPREYVPENFGAISVNGQIKLSGCHPNTLESSRQKLDALAEACRRALKEESYIMGGGQSA